MTYLQYTAYAVVAAITVSPTIAGFAIRATFALPLFWLGIIDTTALEAVALWSAF